MKTQAFNPNIDVYHQCSPLLCRAYLVIFLLVFILASFVSLEWPVRLFVAFALVLAAYDIGRRIQWLHGVERIIVNDDSMFLVYAGERVAIQLSSRVVVMENCLLFHVVKQREHVERGFEWWGRTIEYVRGCRFSGYLILLPDSITPEAHHKLRMMFNAGKLSL